MRSPIIKITLLFYTIVIIECMMWFRGVFREQNRLYTIPTILYSVKRAILLSILLLISYYPVVSGPRPDDFYTEYRKSFNGFNCSRETYLPLIDSNITERVTVLSITLNLSEYNHSFKGDFVEITDDVNLTKPYSSQGIFYEGDFQYIFTTADLNRSILIRPGVNSTVWIPGYAINLVYLNYSNNILYTFDNQHVSDNQRLGPGAEIIIWLYSPFDTEVFFNHSGNMFYFNITADRINRIDFSIDNNADGLAAGERDAWMVLIFTNLTAEVTYFAISPNDGQENPNYVSIPPLEDIERFLLTVMIIVVIIPTVIVIIGIRNQKKISSKKESGN